MVYFNGCNQRPTKTKMVSRLAIADLNTNRSINKNKHRVDH
jgi:hypothetical protein